MDTLNDRALSVAAHATSRRTRRPEGAATSQAAPNPAAGPVAEARAAGGVVALADALRQAIVTGQHAPGARLNETALEAQHGVERETLRDALRVLETRGLVVHEVRRGWRVAAHDEAAIRQLYALRGLLERHAVAGLAETDIEALVEALSAANAHMEKRRAAGDVSGYLRANERFHALILRHAPDEALRLAIALVNDIAAPLRHARLARDLAASTAVEEHAAIIEMLASGQLEAAVDAMHDHILGNADAAVAAAS